MNRNGIHSEPTLNQTAGPAAVVFADYLCRNQARLYGYIHCLVRNLSDADDLYQQTALILWKKFASFDPGQSFFGWACGIARGEIANFRRARARQRLYFSDTLSLLLVEAQEQMTGDELDDRREALSCCVGKLRPQDRLLLTECYADGVEVCDVAHRHGRSSHSVYNSLRRIRRALFACINRTLAQESRPGWIR
jgi:RNA polymerase sigma-70 factor (ECF subfamily)